MSQFPVVNGANIRGPAEIAKLNDQELIDYKNELFRARNDEDKSFTTAQIRALDLAISNAGLEKARRLAKKR